MLLKFRIPHQVQIDFLKRDYSIGQVSFFVLESIGTAQPLQTTDGFFKPQMLVNRNFNQNLRHLDGHQHHHITADDAITHRSFPSAIC